jgi:hypothetical protein
MPEKPEKPAKPKKPAPVKLHTLTLSEMRELWPQSPEGKLCARLLQRWGFTVLIENAVNTDGGPMTASMECGMTKMAASMVRDFGTLGEELPEVQPRVALKPLNRFQKTENPTPEKK